jgi:ABC-type nitrate/sulfonate/bicarbonate transport system permease component
MTRVRAIVRGTAERSLGLLGLVAFFAVWQIGSMFADDTRIPSVGTVVGRMFEWFHDVPPLAGNQLMYTGLWPNVFYTMQNVYLAVIVGTAVGVLVGLVTSRSAVLKLVVDPLVGAAITLPILVTAPFFLIWFGTGRGGHLLVLAFYTAVVLTLYSQRAALNIDPIYPTNATALGASKAFIVRTVLAPSVVPEALAGLRLSLGGAWGLAAVTEVMGSDRGVGLVIKLLSGGLDTVGVMAQLLLLCVVAVVTDIVVMVLVRYVTRWKG